MTAYPLTALATLLAIILYGAFGGLVSRARGRYNIHAPATTGHPDFERRYRVHANTLEALAMLLPVMWLCALWIGDVWAALGGVVWCVGRVIYAWGYLRDANKREIGFYIGSAPFLVMLVADIVAIVMRLR